MKLSAITTICAVGIAILLGGCSDKMAESEDVLVLRFVVDRWKQDDLLIRRDDSLHIPSDGVLRLDATTGIVTMPGKLIDGSIVSNEIPYDVEVTDSDGRLISHGRNVPKGTIGFRGIVVRTEPGAAPSFWIEIDDGTHHREQTARKTAGMPPNLSFRFVTDSAYEGKLLVKEQSDVPLNYELTYELVVKDRSVAVPQGFLTNSPPVYYEVVEVSDRNGNLLSAEEDPPAGVLGVRGMVAASVSGDPVRYYFVITRDPAFSRSPSPRDPR